MLLPVTAPIESEDEAMETRANGERPASVGSRLSPESIARYLDGAPDESSQFDFFIGSWDCDVTLHTGDAGGRVQLGGRWDARWTHGRRLLVDDLSLFLPDGTEVVGWVNLRTYCAESGAWEITGQRALAPAAAVRTQGHWRDGMMHLAFETPDERGALANRVRFHEIREDGWDWQWEYRDAKVRDDAPWIPLATIHATRASHRAR